MGYNYGKIHASTLQTRPLTKPKPSSSMEKKATQQTMLNSFSFLSILWTKRKNGGKHVASNQTLSALFKRKCKKRREKSRKRKRSLEMYIQKYYTEKILHTHTPKLWFSCSTSCTVCVWKLFLLFFVVFEWNGELKYHMVCIFNSK